MQKSNYRIIAAVGILVVVFGVGIAIGVSERGATAQAQSTSTSSLGLDGNAPAGVDMTQFWEAWNVLNQNFVETHASSSIPTQQEKLYGAIAGLAASYNDPYTVFFPPVDAQVFNQDVTGSFDGVGLEIDNNAQGELIVVAPLKDSPAQKAGIETGDIITAIDGTSTIDMASDQAVDIIRGPKGTTVSFTIERKGSAKPLSIPVVRDTINIPVINAYKRPDGIFVIELYSFSANSAQLFQGALRQFVQSGSDKLILDLRGNPGGYLDSAVDIASYFLPVGDTVVTEDFEGKETNVVDKSYGYNVFANDPNFKMAILVDQGSASASEILSGALQQHGVAKLVGTRTFGKGSVQEVMDLGGGAELKVTVARWLTPNGTSISNGGLTPNIEAERTDNDVAAGKDPQTDAAVSYLLSN